MIFKISEGEKTSHPIGWRMVAIQGRRDLFAFSFPEENENRGVVSVELLISTSPPDCCIIMFKPFSK